MGSYSATIGTSALPAVVWPADRDQVVQGEAHRLDLCERDPRSQRDIRHDLTSKTASSRLVDRTTTVVLPWGTYCLELRDREPGATDEASDVM